MQKNLQNSIDRKLYPILFILAFYIVCFVFRAVEYLVVRTDQTPIGEAFIHKIIGILLLAGAIFLLRYKWSDIGFRAKRIGHNLLIGLLLGSVAYTIAYGTEFLIQSVAGNSPSLQFYVTSYAIQGNVGMDNGILFILICIAGNIINVFMEEGVFRGLFPRLMEEKYSFLAACLFSSILFGLWHIAQPVRNALDGEQSVMGAIMSGIILVTTSTLLAVQLCMLVKVTGSLWAGMVVHFINNASANLLHVTATNGVDTLQTVRISVAQSLLFITVLVMYIIHVRRSKLKKDCAA